MLKQLIPGIAVVALLSGCATTDQPSASGKSHGTVAEAVASANAAAKAGQKDKALSILHDSAQANPTDKTPWIRMAQIRYDAHDYGQAIIHAQQALQRDSNDMVSHSIVAVSGLRLASKALADLTRKQNLSGTIRSEAQDLAKLLRTSLGEEELVPNRNIGRTATASPIKKPVAPAAPAGKNPKPNDDPFADLK
jgi:Tfp pilus assembly protein PilF